TLIIVFVVSFLFVKLQAVTWQHIFTGRISVQEIFTVVEEITAGKFGFPSVKLVRKICPQGIGRGHSRPFPGSQGIAVVSSSAAAAPVPLAGQVAQIVGRKVLLVDIVA